MSTSLLQHLLTSISYSTFKHQLCCPAKIDATSFHFYVVHSQTAEPFLRNLTKHFKRAAYTFEQVTTEIVLKELSQLYEERLVTQEETSEKIAPSDALEDLLEDTSEAPAIRLVNQLLTKSVSSGASDIHFEIHEREARVRYRIDGILHLLHKISNDMYPGVISRIKVLANLDIAETRLPQDGRIRLKIGSRDVDFRVSSLPSAFGERLVLRILDQSTGIPKLSQLGFSSAEIETYKSFLSNSTGLILVTGPTGSGKTTTLYSSLQELVSDSQNIITLEDPIEYQLDDINQIQVDTKNGLTFQTGLRSILRQDPDVILVGEIRDTETAEIAVQAALTGHLVFSTLHTTDSVNAITRLIDLGIEPFLVSSAVIGVLAQRLFRRSCTNCSTIVPLTSDTRYFQELSEKGLQTFCRVSGCQECAQTGYSGRIGAYELLPISTNLQRLITQNSPATVLRDAATQDGVRFLHTTAFELLQRHLTTPEEVLRVMSSSFID